MKLDEFMALSPCDKDALVASKVLRWGVREEGSAGAWPSVPFYIPDRKIEYGALRRKHRKPDGTDEADCLDHFWSPTRHISSAWEVIDHIHSGSNSGFTRVAEINGPIAFDGTECERRWTCTFWSYSGDERIHLGTGRHLDSAPLAICIAALRAVGAIED